MLNDPYGGPTTPSDADTDNVLLKKIAKSLDSGGSGGTGGGGGGTTTPVTPHFKALGASGSQVIPSGAKGYFIAILTGTGTIGGEAVSVGVSVGSQNTQGASITVTTAASSSAFVSWET